MVFCNYYSYFLNVGVLFRKDKKSILVKTIVQCTVHDSRIICRNGGIDEVLSVTESGCRIRK